MAETGDVGTTSDIVGSVLSTLHAAQSLPNAQKWIFTVIVIAVAGGILGLLWQSAPPKDESAKSDTGKPTISTTSQGQSGSINSGVANSNNQTGGINAGTYINQVPPVTEQEKYNARAQLISELQELSRFPQRPEKINPPTLLELTRKFTFPHQMFTILNNYYKQTIISVPEYGAALVDFQDTYYKFELAQQDLEERITNEIGKRVTVGSNIRDAWNYYFRYFTLRHSGASVETIKETGWFLNYGITWDDLEKVNILMESDQTLIDQYKTNFHSYERCSDIAQGVLSGIGNVTLP